MQDLMVQTEYEKYPIVIRNHYHDLEKYFNESQLLHRKVCIVTDSCVSKLYLEEVKKCIQLFSAEVVAFVFEAGEHNKNLETIQSCYQFCLENRLDGKSVIVALGGGVTGDMAGFVAATYMRGIPFVQLPTTLLAQVDSSTGGKVGVDFQGNKNLIGAFYQPKFVYINVSTLNTLPQEQFQSGMGEAIKHGLIADESYLQFMIDNKEKIAALDFETMSELVYGSCKIKSSVVSKDEKETGLREILNFGHTFGHAIETLTDFQYAHGHCVATGAFAALKLSEQKGHISAEEAKKAIDLIRYFNLLFPIDSLELESIYQQMFLDKKTKDGKIDLILLEKMGKAYIYKNASQEEVLWGLSCIKE